LKGSDTQHGDLLKLPYPEKKSVKNSFSFSQKTHCISITKTIRQNYSGI